MRVIISGGGTGGHIYPAIAILNELKARTDAEILYVGSPNSMEERLITELGIPFQSVRVRGLPRKINRQTFASMKELFIGLRQAAHIINDFKPDLVIGTGGFVSGPIVFQGALKKKKTLIHEQNSLPGVTNRILSRFVNRVAVTYESSIRHFKRKDKVVVTGNPIRNDIAVDKTSDLYEKYGLSDQTKVILSFGGSNGSESLNQAILEIIQETGNREMPYQILHATGRDHYESFMKDVVVLPSIHIVPYLKNINEAYALSDLIVTSSGAITLSELSYLGKASILIPKAYTTENHQEYNARLYVEEGASEMILEQDLTGQKLYGTIESIMENEDTIRIMGDNARKLGNPHSTEQIVEIACQLAGGRGSDGFI